MAIKVKGVHIIDGNTSVISLSRHWRRRKGDGVGATGYHCHEIGKSAWERARTGLEDLTLYGDIELENQGEIELGVWFVMPSGVSQYRQLFPEVQGVTSLFTVKWKLHDKEVLDERVHCATS